MKKVCADRWNHGLTREEEEQTYLSIREIAQENLDRTAGRISSLSEELHDLLETYGAKDTEALALWHNTESQLQETKRDLIRCQKARKKPYFGRIDFLDPKLCREESYYVGRVGVSDEDANPVVIDWRAPVASVYYEQGMGLCRYTVKSVGVHEIDLKRKRTYEIADDHLVDFFDSDVVANDELLTKYLAKSKKAVLGEIIATIQKEQNQIIRRSPKTNVIVQGVAGSGKTTVAMHRISYILYNYEEFRPEDFYIIGSNRILLNYITGVLPDLDVYGIAQMTMEQLFVRLLYEDWDPHKHRIVALDKKDQNSYLKGSYVWFHDLEDFCRNYERQTVPRGEIRLEEGGVLLMNSAKIDEYLESHPASSMQEKVHMLNQILLSRLENETSGKYVSYTAQRKKELHRQYKNHFGKDEWKGSIYEVYVEFLKSQARAGKSVYIDLDCYDVYDLAALAYIYRRIKEADGIREASHVIIDEAQDFGMMAYGVLKFCMRDCTYTIMGDVSQNIHYGYGLNDWEELKALMLEDAYDSFDLLKKSYRNTVEISDFATEILRHGEFPVYPVEPIIRHGNRVDITACADDDEMIFCTAARIKAWQQMGHETIAVICSSEAEADYVSAKLERFVALADHDPETAEFGSGVMVLPVAWTKGLEFDAVMLYDPSVKSYPARDQYVKLLYVAATRALHELEVVHKGDLTELIAKPVSELKRMRSLEQEDEEKRRKAAQPFVRPELTTRELEAQDTIDGKREIERRNYMGPKRLSVEKQKIKTEPSDTGRRQGCTGVQGTGSVLTPGNQEEARTGQLVNKRVHEGGHKSTGQQAGKVKPLLKQVSFTEEDMNPSPYPFGSGPHDNSVLRPKGHGRIDTAVRWVKKAKNYLDISSNYGVLRLTPIDGRVIRVQFHKGQIGDFAGGCWEQEPLDASKNPWSAKESKSAIMLTTEQIVVKVEKKTGALQFFDRAGKKLLEEKALLPRQLEGTVGSLETWSYFEWSKTEHLHAKGMLRDHPERLTQKAVYISFGGKKLRMPLVLSDRGYGIAVAADSTVLCCDIQMYGPYIYTAGMPQIDYYFIWGGSHEDCVSIYETMTK